jgi:A/G-specific adenine glycosylase
VSKFASALIAWHGRHGRRGLPWQATRDPYRIWLSEVMLQQTQVATVIPYYARFLRRFPTARDLAQASEDDVLRLWSGLGYYARGRNLHAAAKQIALNGFPRTASAIQDLPGIGRSTAAAIAAFAFGERAPILDGNVKRVLARYHGIEGWPGDKPVESALWSRAEALLPENDVATYTQALMDLGATVCTSRAPRCDGCPVRLGCQARKLGRTVDIPAPRPRKALPRKSVTWLLLLDGNRILLEKRPSSGLWGGLWSFPAAPTRDLPGYCRGTLRCELRSRRALEPLEHGFTHFRLLIRPLVCKVRRMPDPETSGRRWMDMATAHSSGVPAPVRTLIGRLDSYQEH